jgi:hypothetical protein
MSSGTLRVVFEARAAREVAEIDEWWREHRPAAPDLFARELQRVLAVIAVVPHAGAPVLKEVHSDPASGYIVVYNADRRVFGLAAKATNDQGWVCIGCHGSFIDTLMSM